MNIIDIIPVNISSGIRKILTLTVYRLSFTCVKIVKFNTGEMQNLQDS